MMNEHILTLTEFFLVEEENLEDTKNSLLTTEEYMKNLQEKLDLNGKSIKRSLFADELLEKLSGLLDIEFKTIMVNSWNKYQLFRTSMEKSKASPEDKVLFPLAEHTIKSKFKPKVKVILNDDITIHTIDFEIDLKLNLTGFVVAIKNQKITKISTGECKASGTVKCEGAVLLKKDLGKISLPDSILFEEEKAPILE